ncbi:MAG: hypothetical protein FJ312_00475 [SAR202 cluster bacterium]|nr:hypothetical protein [SAR202 cluster bacterium]
MRGVGLVVVTAALVVLLVAACGGKEVIVTKEVVEQVTVVKEVTVEKELLATVVVEQTKIAIATPTPPPAGQARFGGTLRIVSQASIPTLDPIIGGAYVTGAVSSHIYETPFGWDAKFTDQPRMVDSWSVSDDGLAWTFTLRTGLTFHDGSLVTADDVGTTFTRWLESWYSIAGLMRDFTAEDPFTVVNENTFSIKLKQPTGALVMALAKPYGSPHIMPSRIDGGKSSAEPVEEWVGSGPYKFVRWDQGDKVVLERFDGYVSRAEPSSLYTGRVYAYLDELVWLEISDEETKIAGLETGEWDVVDGAGLDMYNRLRDNPGLAVPLYKPGHRSNLFLIPGQPPFNDVNARLAMQTGMDVAAVMASLGPRDLWTLCPAIYYCGTRWETEAGADGYYNANDKDRARQLLSQSGYAGETMILLNPTDYSTITPTGFVVRQEMEDMGFTVEMPALDWATVVTKFGNPDSFNVATSWDVHWNSTSPLEHETLADLPLFFFVERLQALRKQFAQATTEEEKLRLVDEIQAEFYKNVPALYLGIFYSIYPATAALKDFEVKAFPFYANSWLER